MLTSEERIEAMHARAAEIERRQRIVKAGLAGAASVCVSVLLIIVTAFNMPLFMNKMMAGDGEDLSGSIFADSPSLGLIVIGILAFILGVTVTMLCFMLRNWSKGSAAEDGK